MRSITKSIYIEIKATLRSNLIELLVDSSLTSSTYVTHSTIRPWPWYAITSAESLHAIHTQAMSQSQGERLQFREIELADFMLHWKALFALSRVTKCSVFHVVSLSFGFYLSFYRDLFTFVGFFRVLSTLKFSNFCMIFLSLFIDFLLSFLELKLKVRNRNFV